MLVLGISCYYHDSGAALVRDGKLIAAAEEERFTRVKHDFGFPSRAIEYCLQEAGATINDVDHIGFYEKPLIKFNRILETILASWPRTYRQWLTAMPLWLGHRLRIGCEIQDKLGTDKEILYTQHHISHAASAFLVSPYEEAAIITADGVGEWTTTAWGVGRGNQIELKNELRFPHSIGLLFSAITSYLGFQVNDAEWKVMGLAPYGEPRFVDKFREVVDIKDDGSIRLNLKYFAQHYSTTRTINHHWERLFGQPQRPSESEMTDFHRDIAASGQKIVEEIMVKLARHVQRKTRMKNVCIAGGVGLNCVANWRILQETDFENIFIQPAAGDSGGALGTAFYIYNTVLDRPREFRMDHALWGPGFTEVQIKAALDQSQAKYESIADESELLCRTAKMIADGKVVGWFQGRLEFGPRALGARSLLADARIPKMKDIINAKVKFREAFRPFAPAVLKERAHEFFDMPAGMDAPFMLLVPKVREDKRALIPAVTHQDGTGRVQTVTDEVNGRYYRLIREFDRLTGVPVVINTSFNVRGEPIVCTPHDAWHTFVNTGIDALVMGNFIVTQKLGQVDFEAGMQRSVSLEAHSRTAESVTVR
ncbi:MAG: carbamoyltransferase [Planctomycetes bacterium]|nr:carbamoyltransferase [Planctomycetota bacterium]MBI3835775.1 carbamoyltransferase [Planctomycetota bacterium]